MVYAFLIGCSCVFRRKLRAQNPILRMACLLFRVTRKTRSEELETAEGAVRMVGVEAKKKRKNNNSRVYAFNVRFAERNRCRPSRPAVRTYFIISIIFIIITF